MPTPPGSNRNRFCSDTDSHRVGGDQTVADETSESPSNSEAGIQFDALYPPGPGMGSILYHR